MFENTLYSSGNHTPGSWCNSLVGQTHPSESLGLTLILWMLEQTRMATLLVWAD